MADRHELLISVAPTDPDEKKQWAKQMARVQYAMWVDSDATCRVCGKPYTSPDDFLARNPRVGELGQRAGMPDFVDDACWPIDETEERTT